MAMDEAERAILAMFPAVQAALNAEPAAPWAKALQPELRKLLNMVTGTWMKRKDGAYSAAHITFVDRDAGTMRTICYPVTRVQLLNIHQDRMPENGRTFIAVEDGSWQEAQ